MTGTLTAVSQLQVTLTPIHNSQFSHLSRAKKGMPPDSPGDIASEKYSSYFSLPNSTNLSRSLSTDRISKQVAVQNTGLVIQWWPLQLPSSFWIRNSRPLMLSYHFFHSLSFPMIMLSPVWR